MSDTFEFLTESIGNLVEFEVENMRPETALSDLGLDSLDYVSLQLAVKKKYAVEINFDDFSSGLITNIAQFCSYIESRMATV